MYENKFIDILIQIIILYCNVSRCNVDHSPLALTWLRQTNSALPCRVSAWTVRFNSSSRERSAITKTLTFLLKQCHGTWIVSLQNSKNLAQLFRNKLYAKIRNSNSDSSVFFHMSICFFHVSAWSLDEFRRWVTLNRLREWNDFQHILVFSTLET